MKTLLAIALLFAAAPVSAAPECARWFCPTNAPCVCTQTVVSR